MQKTGLFIAKKLISGNIMHAAFNKYVSNFNDNNNNVTKKPRSFLKNRKQDHACILALAHLTMQDSIVMH